MLCFWTCLFINHSLSQSRSVTVFLFGLTLHNLALYRNCYKNKVFLSFFSYFFLQFLPELSSLYTKELLMCCRLSLYFFVCLFVSLFLFVRHMLYIGQLINSYGQFVLFPLKIISKQGYILASDLSSCARHCCWDVPQRWRTSEGLPPARCLPGELPRQTQAHSEEFET